MPTDSASSGLLAHTTHVPVHTYATWNGYPISRYRYHRERLRLRLMHLVAPIANTGQRARRWLARLCRCDGEILDTINTVRGCDSAKTVAGSPLIYTGKVADRHDMTYAPLFCMPGIRRQPFWDTADFHWIKTMFEDNHARIAAELGALAPPTRQTFGMAAWGTRVLFAGNIENTAVTAQCPFTTGLLKRVPRFYGGHACFSITRPRGHIIRHTGEYNWILRVQLALEIPERSYFEVAGVKIEWIPGKAFVFDDSYVHMAANPSDRPRSVLFFDFYHPDLSAADVRTLTAMQTAKAPFAALTEMSD